MKKPTHPKRTDLFELWLAGEVQQVTFKQGTGIAIPILSDLRGGRLVACVEHIDRIAKFTGRKRDVVAAALCQRVMDRVAKLAKEIAA